jgi:UDP-N-acetylglucosamine 2-epimerase (non-hydrolysing)
MQHKVMVVFGTRPETIKLAPVMRALEGSSSLRPFICVTGQHREMLDQMLTYFDLRPHRDLAVMEPDQDLSNLTARLLTGLRTVVASERPDAIVIQGDTTTTFVAALVGYYHRVPTAHVEAGLRTGDPYNPFPEEINRRLTTHVATWHFAPTSRARENLLQEGVPSERITVTGNTIVDAMHQILGYLDRHPEIPPPALGDGRIEGRRLILVTGHRRESFGEGLRNICSALRTLADTFADVCIVYPVHLNPNVRGPVHELLGEHPRIVLTEPLGYLPFVQLMRRAHLIVSDSGGVQEEAPSLGVPVLVTRETTERPEGIEAGVAKLVGTKSDGIVAAATHLLTDERAHRSMVTATNPYGDGHAAEAIVARLEADLGPGASRTWSVRKQG